MSHYLESIELYYHLLVPSESCIMALKPNFEELDQLKDGQPRTFVRSVARYNNDTGKYRKTAVMTKEQLEREIYYTFKANPPPKIKEKSTRFSDPVNTFINCAKKQANTLTHNIRLLNTCDKKSMLPP